MYGFHLREPAVVENLRYTMGTNSATFNIGDPLTIESGLLTVSSAGDRVVGICNEYKVCAADNATVAQYKVSYIPAFPQYLFEADMDADGTQATVIGFYCNMTGTTGATQVDHSGLSSTVGQFYIHEIDPRGESDLSRVLCSVAEPQNLAYAQA